jgi:hypothetical protein
MSFDFIFTTRASSLPTAAAFADVLRRNNELALPVPPNARGGLLSVVGGGVETVVEVFAWCIDPCHAERYLRLGGERTDAYFAMLRDCDTEISVSASADAFEVARAVAVAGDCQRRRISSRSARC